MEAKTVSSEWAIIRTSLLTLSLYVLYKLINRIILTYRLRTKHTDIPALPRHWLWGNLVNCGTKLDPSLGRHPDYGFEEAWEELGRPSCFLVDLAPVETLNFLIVAEPDVMEQIVQPSKNYKYSFPKSDTLSHLDPLIGQGSLLVQDGEEWRNLRKRFNKGFSPSHLHTMTPLIIEKIRTFLSRLETASTSGSTFKLRNYSEDLTTDVITQLVIEEDFGAQTIPEGKGSKSRYGLLTAIRNLSSLVYKVGQGFNPIVFLDPIRPTRAFIFENIYNRKVRQTLKQKLRDEEKSGKNSKRTVVQLALEGMDPTPALLNNTVSQIKTFLFAGQDTTSTVIQWMCYHMWQSTHSAHHLKILTRLQEEHESVFGSGKYSALDILQNPNSNSESILNSQLPYTTAFIKETLRLHPPAGTARLVPAAGPDAPPVSIIVDGKSTRIDGLRVYGPPWLIQRNSKVWGEDALVFRPERFLDEAYMATVPTGAWRPFERGPRNCIGQELAMIELKLVLCAIARGFEFEKVGLTGRNGEKEIWNIHNVTTLPCDGMVMKVKVKN